MPNLHVENEQLSSQEHAASLWRPEVAVVAGRRRRDREGHVQGLPRVHEAEEKILRFFNRGREEFLKGNQPSVVREIFHLFQNVCPSLSRDYLFF